MSFNNKGFIFIEIIMSLILIFTLLTIFVATNSNLVRLLEEIKLDKIFYINSLNIGYELIIYLLDHTNSFLELGRNYSLYEIEDQFFKFNFNIDERIKEKMQIKLIREYSINSYVLYNLRIDYCDNKVIYLFFR